MSAELPPLPEPRMPDEHGAGWFTAGQMRAYALAARTAAMEEAAAIVQANALACEIGSMLSVYLASNAAAIRALADKETA